MHNNALQLHIQDISPLHEGQRFSSVSLKWNLDNSHMSRRVSFGVALKQVINTCDTANQYASPAYMAPGSCNFLNQSTLIHIFQPIQI